MSLPAAKGALKGRLRRATRNLPLVKSVRLARRRRQIDMASHQLSCVRALPPPPADAVVLVACMRDEALRLPDFLRHYRELGVTRFALIDNDSVDDTAALALNQPDVELFSTSSSFAANNSGMNWINALVRHYGLERWYLYVDLDEHLIYDGCEENDLPALTAHLDACGLWSLPAFMLDMYADRPIWQVHYRPRGRLIDACPFFDRDYEVDSDIGRCWGSRGHRIEYAGGPRHRLFSGGLKFPPTLAKVPLVKWTRDTLYLSPHEIHPRSGNFAPLRGCLLHFKFLSDFHDRAMSALEHGQHWNGSCEYRAYLAELKAKPNLRLSYEGTRRFVDSATLMQYGLITPIDWIRDAAGEQVQQPALRRAAQ